VGGHGHASGGKQLLCEHLGRRLVGVRLWHVRSAAGRPLPPDPHSDTPCEERCCVASSPRHYPSHSLPFHKYFQNCRACNHAREKQLDRKKIVTTKSARVCKNSFSWTHIQTPMFRLLFVTLLCHTGAANAFTVCTPNEELSFCVTELDDIADTIRFSMLQNPGWEDLFTVDGTNVADTLERLSEQLTHKINECPCIGTCTLFDECNVDALEW